MIDTNLAHLHQADAEAFARITAVEPRLIGIRRAQEVVEFVGRELLHAGPPLGPRLPSPMRNSAAAAIVYEGWASDRGAALEMLNQHNVALAPAQDRNCVVPLAGVLSPSMAVLMVSDLEGGADPAFAPFNGGNVAPMRVGLPTTDVIENLRWLNGPFADEIGPAMERGIDLLSIADRALLDGDDCHGRTSAGTVLLRAQLERNGLAPEGLAANFLGQAAGFFLNLWMAATKCMLSAAAGVKGSSAIIAAGGNGVDFGIKLAADKRQWITCLAKPPMGKLSNGVTDCDMLPAIGDSAVVDFWGLGAMAMAYAPVQRELLAEFMPEQSDVLARALLFGPHPRLVRSSARFGSCARRLADRSATLPISLGIIDALGERGRMGSGIYCPPRELFRQARELLA